jgi:hypothetical protein
VGCSCCGTGTDERSSAPREEQITGGSVAIAEPRTTGPDQCTLDESPLEARRGEWRRLVEQYALGHERRPEVLSVRFQGKASARKELNTLVALEDVCCSHLSWKVTQHGSELLLTVGGPDVELDSLRTLSNA